MKKGERPILTNVSVVPGETSNVENTKIIDASGTSSQPFTGTIRPIAVIPLDQGGNVIPSGNGVVLKEDVVPIRGPEPTTTGTVPPPINGVFIDIQNLGTGMATVEVRQTLTVMQGRAQIEIGPNKIIKDAGAGSVSFERGATNRRMLP